MQLLIEELILGKDIDKRGDKNRKKDSNYDINKKKDKREKDGKRTRTRVGYGQGMC